jgi:hypothetical protein
MRRTHLLAAALPALLATSCGGPVFFGEVVIPELTVGLSSVQFVTTVGAPPEFWCDPSGVGDPPCLARTFAYDFGDKVPLAGDSNVTLDLRMTSLTIVLRPLADQPAGVTDLGSIKAVTLKLIDPAYVDQPLDEQLAHAIVIASYVQTEPAPTTIVVSGNANTDLGPYALSGKLSIRAELSFEADSPEFVADVASSYSMILEYDYWSAVF